MLMSTSASTSTTPHLKSSCPSARDRGESRWVARGEVVLTSFCHSGARCKKSTSLNALTLRRKSVGSTRLVLPCSCMECSLWFNSLFFFDEHKEVATGALPEEEGECERLVFFLLHI